MSAKRTVYLVLAIAGLVVPWYFNLQFFADAGLREFIEATGANPAVRSISNDLFIATVTGSVWMYLESKRIGMRFAWLYILIAFLVAFSFALPLYLYMREARISPEGNVAA